MSDINPLKRRIKICFGILITCGITLTVISSIYIDLFRSNPELYTSIILQLVFSLFNMLVISTVWLTIKCQIKCFDNMAYCFNFFMLIIISVKVGISVKFLILIEDVDDNLILIALEIINILVLMFNVIFTVLVNIFSKNEALNLDSENFVNVHSNNIGSNLSTRNYLRGESHNHQSLNNIQIFVMPNNDREQNINN